MNLSLILHPLDYSGLPTRRSPWHSRWRSGTRQISILLSHVQSSRRGIDGEEAAHARLREFVEARNPEAAMFETVILTGDPVTAVADYARHKSPDLLVVDRTWALGQHTLASRESSPRS